jgi:hypothetical protein
MSWGLGNGAENDVSGFATVFGAALGERLCGQPEHDEQSALGALSDAKHRNSRRKLPVLDDEPFANRRPPLDPVIIESEYDRLSFDRRLAIRAPQWLNHGGHPVLADFTGFGHPIGELDFPFPDG